MPTVLLAPPPPAALPAPPVGAPGLPDENGVPMDMDGAAAEDSGAGAAVPTVPAVAVATPRGALAARSPPFKPHALQVPAQGRSHALLSGIFLKAPRPASTEAQTIGVRAVANSGGYELPLAQEAASGVEGASKENDFDEDIPIAL